MRRFLIGALAIGLLSGAMIASPASAHTEHRFSRWARSECRFGPFSPDSHVIKLIRCAHRQVGQTADIPMSLMIAYNESHYSPKARNATSTAGGLYQWLSSSWPGTQFSDMMRRYGLPNDRFDARAAAFVSARIMGGPQGFGPWCGYTTYC